MAQKDALSEKPVFYNKSEIFDNLLEMIGSYEQTALRKSGQTEILQEKNVLISEYFNEMTRVDNLNRDITRIFKGFAQSLGVSEKLAFSDPAVFKKKVKHFSKKTRHQEMQDAFKAFYCAIKHEKMPVYNEDTELLMKWLDALRKEFEAVRKSERCVRRYAIGDKIVKILTLGLSRTEKNTPMNRFVKIIEQIESQPFDLQDNESIIKLIEQCETDFNALINSSRWRIGHYIIYLGRMLLLKSNPPLPTSRIRKTFVRFKQWQDRQGVRQNS